MGRLQKAIGHRFRDRGLLDLALTHASCAMDQGEPAGDNQRLEFLGDAVAGMVISRILYERHADADEGYLTMARSSLVNRGSMAALAREISLGDCLRLGKAEDRRGGRNIASILGNAFEALVGAIYLDAGPGFTARWLERTYERKMEALPAHSRINNPKGQLQELLQTLSAASVEYRLDAVSGPDHALLHSCSVHHRGEELGSGTGRSRKQAEMAAAREALERLQRESRTGECGDRRGDRRDPPAG